MKVCTKNVRKYDSQPLFPLKDRTEEQEVRLNTQNASKIVLFIYVEQMDVGATLDVIVEDRYSDAVPWKTTLPILIEELGQTQHFVTEFSNIIRVKTKPNNGNVRFSIGFKIDESGFLGRIDDKIKAAIVFDPTEDPSNIIPSLGRNLFYDEMNENFGGIPRQTTLDLNDGWVTLYNYLGAGLFLGFILTLEQLSTNWKIKVTIDGQEMFGVNGTSLFDLENDDVFGFDSDTTKALDQWIGISLRGDQLRWQAPLNLPIKFAQSVNIQVIRDSNIKRQFRAGIVSVTKVIL